MPKLCKDDMDFVDCQLAIVRERSDTISDIQKKNVAQDVSVVNMLKITREFIRNKKLVCYGGSAINDILPPDARFYNPKLDVPDYDFYSPKAMEHAIELADIFHKAGYGNIEAKAGVHHGTYKVFADYVPVADITMIPYGLFKKLQKEAMVIDHIHYAPPGFLRMSMHLELSRPMGDVSRWEKVVKRLELLDHYYPMRGENCPPVNISKGIVNNDSIQKNIFDTVLQQGGVFFGAFASGMFMKNGRMGMTPSFDVLATNPNRMIDILKNNIRDLNVTIEIEKHEEINEIIPEHYTFIVNGKARIYVYKPIACHNYNVIHEGDISIRVATVDTILSFYLAFIYAGTEYNVDRLMCMSYQLFKMHRDRESMGKPLMRRYTLPCIGKQMSLRDIMVQRGNKMKSIKNKTSKEYQSWFLKYDPSNKKKKGGKTRKARK